LCHRHILVPKATDCDEVLLTRLSRQQTDKVFRPTNLASS